MERSKRYHIEDVLDMWEDIPDDNNDLTDESSGEDVDLLDSNYIPPDDEIDVSEPEETSTTETNTAETPNTRTPKSKAKLPRKHQTTNANDRNNEQTVQEQIKMVEDFLSKKKPSYPLSVNQIKDLQKFLSSKGQKLTVSQIPKLVEIARP